MTTGEITDDVLLRALADLARICASRPDRASFASSLVLQVLRPFEARAAGVGIVDSQGELDMRTMYGFAAGTLRDGPRFALTGDLPLPDAVRRGVVIAGPTPELRLRYPAVASYAPRADHMIYMPLLFRGATIGGIAIAMDASPDHEAFAPFWSAVADLVSATIAVDEQGGARERSKRSGPLSVRQHQILAHMQKGSTNSQIARAMNFGTSTIGHDIMRIFDVLGVESRREAVDAAERAGILPPLQRGSQTAEPDLGA